MVDVRRLDSFQTRLTDEQRIRLASNPLLCEADVGTAVEVAMEQVLLEIKDSIGLPFRIDPMGYLTIKTPYLPRLSGLWHEC